MLWDSTKSHSYSALIGLVARRGGSIVLSSLQYTSQIFAVQIAEVYDIETKMIRGRLGWIMSLPQVFEPVMSRIAL